MRNIENVVLSVAQANAKVGIDMEPGFWHALIRMIDYPELTFSPSDQTIRYPGYVPFEDLANEWVEGIESGIYDVRQCERCAGYFDISVTDGIFGKLAEREEFLCGPCANTMTAKEYFDRFVARGDVY